MMEQPRRGGDRQARVCRGGEGERTSLAPFGDPLLIDKSYRLEGKGSTAQERTAQLQKLLSYIQRTDGEWKWEVRNKLARGEEQEQILIITINGAGDALLRNQASRCGVKVHKQDSELHADDIRQLIQLATTKEDCA